MPLLVPDTPVVTWWPRRGPSTPSGDPLGMLAQRRVTDAAAAPEPAEALAALAAGYRPGDTDLSWTRATTWRSGLAATLDQPHGEITGGSVCAESRNPSACLRATWLTQRLKAPFTREVSEGPGVTEVRFAVTDGDITIARPDGRTAFLSRPGQQDRRGVRAPRDTPELVAVVLRRVNTEEIIGERLAGVSGGGGGESE